MIYYYLRGGKLFENRRGVESRILSFCLDDPRQGPVVMLPILVARDGRCVARLHWAYLQAVRAGVDVGWFHGTT